MDHGPSNAAWWTTAPVTQPAAVILTRAGPIVRAVDESRVTGEAMPQAKRGGERVLSGVPTRAARTTDR